MVLGTEYTYKINATLLETKKKQKHTFVDMNMEDDKDRSVLGKQI